MPNEEVKPVETTNPVTEIVQDQASAKDPLVALEELQKKLANKQEEAERMHKKVEKFEKEEAERLKAQMTELEKAQAERDEAKRLLGELQTEKQKRAIAEKIGLPLSFADRLKGATPEEMEADAKQLLEAMPKPKVQPIGTTAPAEGQAAGETLDQRRARIRGGGVDIFNPDVAKQYGGGVISNNK